MFELVQVGAHSYYIESPAKIGLVQVSDESVCFIDSGSDKDAARRARKILNTNNWQLQAIYNTHSHADHIGGNHYLQSQTDCPIFAPAINCAFTNHPILEPTFLYGSAPPKALQHKFLMARESCATPLHPETCAPDLEIIPLPGHCFDMVGFRSRDDVVYLADCLVGAATLEKYKIPYISDVAAYLDTLAMVKGLQASCFVPAHADATEDIVPLADLNIETVHEIAAHILTCCEQPLLFEELLQRLFQRLDLTMTFDQYVLVGTTVRAFLTWLYEDARLKMSFVDHTMRWQVA